MADKIDYIGSDNFLITVENNITEQFIFNKNNGITIKPDDVHNITIHKTLPFVIINGKQGFKILDSYGRIFNIDSIAKYFRCSYCKNRTDIIKVDLDYATKYITNRLIPITNMHEIMKLKTEEWIPM